jgi:hypothetical protein
MTARRKPKSNLSLVSALRNSTRRGVKELKAVRKALRRIDKASLETCMQQRLLPFDLVTSLQIAQSICETVLPAQLAQAAHGIPASLLIARALTEFSWGHEALKKNTANGWFMREAEQLASDPHVRSLIASLSNPANFLSRLLLCKSFDLRLRKDLVGLITDFHLQALDTWAWEAWSKPIRTSVMLNRVVDGR